MRLEAASWRKLRPFLLTARLDPVRVENPIHPGTPDVNLANGTWLELKALHAYPKREGSIVKIPHYTPQQRVWIYRRHKFGGRVHLVLEIADESEWLLFGAEFAARHVGRVPRFDLVEGAMRVTSDPALVVEAILR